MSLARQEPATWFGAPRTFHPTESTELTLVDATFWRAFEVTTVPSETCDYGTGRI